MTITNTTNYSTYNPLLLLSFYCLLLLLFVVVIVIDCLLFFRVNHSKNAIVKPQGKTPEMAQREVDEAMRKVREATQVIQTSIEPREVINSY